MTTLQELLEQWEARSKDALPTHAMLINKHIRELRAALAQQGEPVCHGCGIPAGDVHMSTCKSGKWPSRVSNGDTAAPAPQAQGKSDNYLSGYCTGRTDLLKEQSAQPVAQPLSDDQIEDIGFEMLPEAQRKDFIEFARAIEAAHGIREVK